MWNVAFFAVTAIDGCCSYVFGVLVTPQNVTDEKFHRKISLKIIDLSDGWSLSYYM